MSEPIISIGIAGSTERTVQCAQAVFADQRFQIKWVLTPQPKPIGRKKEILPNPLHQFALDNSFGTVLIEKNIDLQIKHQIEKLPEIDILLVVDFGYLVPGWLLSLPKIAPVNIHPSFLPRWRGSSPGQFVILYGETDSAVTVMTMNDKLDQGDIISQLSFAVDQSWNQQQYYQHAFAVVTTELSEVLYQFVNGKLNVQPQPEQSPTIMAARLNREDGFIEWDIVSNLIEGKAASSEKLPVVIQNASAHHRSLAATIVAAHKAFSPWPGLWSYVPTHKGQQRMKILSCHIDPTNENKLLLESVQLEGRPVTTWAHAKSVVVS